MLAVTVKAVLGFESWFQCLEPDCAMPADMLSADKTSQQAVGSSTSVIAYACPWLHAC